MQKAYLLLEDGLLVEGTAIGKIGTSGGEICFNTGMTGYQEIYTDPSYYGQIIVNTTAHIGNYRMKGGRSIFGLKIVQFIMMPSAGGDPGTLREQQFDEGLSDSVRTAGNRHHLIRKITSHLCVFAQT